MWYRVFGMNQASLYPADVLEFLNEKHPGVTGHFRGDDSGWFGAELLHPDADTPIEMARYLAGEEGIRRELNSWAAWIEDAIGEARGGPWMGRIIGTTQVITLRVAGEDPDMEKTLDEFLVVLCRYLAQATDGLYQVDGRGLFASDGSLIVPEVL